MRKIVLALAVLLLLGCTSQPRTVQETRTTPASASNPTERARPEMEPTGTDPGATSGASAPAQDQQPHLSPDRPGLPPDALVLEFVDMVDATVGWAVGHRGTERFTSRILRTADGGDTWADVTPDDVGKFNTAAHFFMGDLGWVALHRGYGAPLGLLHTRDGGQTWGQTTLQAPGFDVTNMHFVDARHGWMMVHLGAGTGHFSADLWRTRDGGESWEKVATTVPGSNRPAQLPDGGSKTGIGFRSPELGWVGYGSYVAHGTNWLYVTRDGGENWQRQPLPVPDDFMEGHLFTYPPRFFSPTEGVLGLRFITENGRGLMIYRTRDGGETWTGTTPLLTAGVRPPVIAFTDADHGWAIDGVRLYATSDGGQQWNALTTDIPLTDARQLEFATDQVGWLLTWDGRDQSRSELWRTADGGRTWALTSGRWQGQSSTWQGVGK